MKEYINIDNIVLSKVLSNLDNPATIATDATIAIGRLHMQDCVEK